MSKYSSIPNSWHGESTFTALKVRLLKYDWYSMSLDDCCTVHKVKPAAVPEYKKAA